MYSSSRSRFDKLKKSKKERKLTKLIQNSESEGDESEHELSYYIKDKVKLMKEILKIMKPKKIKMMAPEFMKSMPMEEINSMLLEELLGISKKRLQYIFEGKHFEGDSSSEEEEDNADIISLDDISDGELIILDSGDEKSSKKHRKHHHKRRIKEEPGMIKKIKKEKPDKLSSSKKAKEKGASKEKAKEPMGEENLMSVLELLELQARARAIRSQLSLEAEKKQQEVKQQKLAQQVTKQEVEDDDDEIIIEVPKNEEIIIPSESDSDGDIKFTEETTEGANKLAQNAMENTPATAINENVIENEDINRSSASKEGGILQLLDNSSTSSQTPEKPQEESNTYISDDKNVSEDTQEVSSFNDNENQECVPSKSITHDLHSTLELQGVKIEGQEEDKSGESSETAEIGDWKAQKAQLESEISKLEQDKHNKVDEEPNIDNENLVTSQRELDEDGSSSENDTLAAIAEKEKRKMSKLKKKEKRKRKCKKKRRKKEKVKDDKDDISSIERQSQEVESLIKNVEEHSQKLENFLEHGSKSDNKVDEDNRSGERTNQELKSFDGLEKKQNSETEEGELGTTSEEEGSEDSTDNDFLQFKGTVSEYKRLIEEANQAPEGSTNEASTSEQNSKLLGENVPDLKQQKAEEKANKLREKRLRHMKGALESYKKDMCADSGSDSDSKKGVKIIESVVLKPAIKINPKTLKRRVEVDNNDEIVINVDQDDLDCIICD